MIAKRLLWLSLSIIIIGGGLLIWHYFDPNFSLFDSQPNLKDTMKEIQDGLNNVGPVSYVLKYHNDTTGEDKPMTYKVEISKVSADPNTCFLIYEQRTFLNAAHQDTGSVVQLRDVKRIVVRTMEQEVASRGVLTEHPGFSVKSTPPVFVVEPEQPESGARGAFFFLNEAQANKMAKALIHAAGLCGGGK
jgi:hypothetical protein